MIRAALLLLALATPALALDDEALLALCEPETIRIDDGLLTTAEWSDLARQEAAIPNGVGRLWQVRAPDGATSYLWGTMHAMDPRISNVPDELKAIIAGSRIMITEYSGAQVTLQDARDWWRAEDFYADRPTGFYNSLPSPALQALLQRIEFFGIGPEDLPYVQPATMMNLLLAGPCDDRWSVSGYPIQDLRVELLAADIGLPRISAEPPGIIEVAANQRRWRKAFRAMVTSYALYQTMPETTGSFMALYLEGRIGGMMALDQVYLQHVHPDLDVAGITADMDDYLLRHRNRNMITRIAPELASGGAVVAVGAYHLPQDYGLVALLRAEGFSVRRIAVPGEVD